MKLSQLVGERSKSAPENAVIESQKLMVKGGYLKGLSSGIYSLFTPAQKISKKIQAIIREEMDRIDGQEVLFPVVMPASIWEESGRYTSIGSEMARFKDRSGNDLVLGMTHEEAAVHLVRNTMKSYTQYPFMIYQIQTKFRDEPRSRGGLIRVREFTMKDAYSFHTSEADLEAYYERCYEAYERIFKRVGAKRVLSVQSDSGMMGGRISHEFMLLSDVGEDSLVLCKQCDYRANMEVAQHLNDGYQNEARALEKVHTPNAKSIEEVSAFLNLKPQDMCKAVVYQENLTDDYIIAFLRGDLEVNETKLRQIVGAELHPATQISPESGIVAGFIGPMKQAEGVRYVFDQSLEGLNQLVCGANEVDYHYVGVQLERDCPFEVRYHDFAKVAEGDCCPQCGEAALTLEKGIEVGNIFQLGTKYSESMGMTYIDAENKQQFPIMGCYGIGVGRLIASICEEQHDDYGPIWPISIAPWEVEVCNLRREDEAVTEVAERLYRDLREAGVDTLYDDRKLRPGAMFADADLIGAPIRVVVSPKTLERGVLEVTTRDKSYKADLPLAEAFDGIMALRAQLFEALSVH